MRTLLVANQTLNSPIVQNTVKFRVAEGNTSFHVLVPATEPQDQVAPPGDDAIPVAKRRLQQALETLPTLGAREVTGAVGTADPFEAVSDELAENHYDAIVLCTLPLGRSRWLGRDLPNRLRRKFPDVMLDHIVVEPSVSA